MPNIFNIHTKNYNFPTIALRIITIAIFFSSSMVNASMQGDSEEREIEKKTSYLAEESLNKKAIEVFRMQKLLPSINQEDIIGKHIHKKMFLKFD